MGRTASERGRGDVRQRHCVRSKAQVHVGVLKTMGSYRSLATDLALLPTRSALGAAAVALTHSSLATVWGHYTLSDLLVGWSDSVQNTLSKTDDLTFTPTSQCDCSGVQR